MFGCLYFIYRGVHGSSSPDQPAGSARNRPATTRTDQSDGRLRVATHRTRTLRFGWRVSSPKTRATRPDHQINNIRRHSKDFRQKITNTGDIFALPTTIYMKSTRSNEIRRYFIEDLVQIRRIRPNIGQISPDLAKFRHRRRNSKPTDTNPKTDGPEPENPTINTGRFRFWF